MKFPTSNSPPLSTAPSSSQRT